jgi:two-component system KDP operon response regulator KdpE
MMKHSGVTLSHVKLLRSVWGLEYGGELEYLRTYVCMLWKKIEKTLAKPEYIVNELILALTSPPTKDLL